MAENIELLNAVPAAVVPPFFRIKRYLEEAIDRGEYPVGSRLPSTKQLMQMFGVSCTPIERVLIEMSREGRIVTIPGKGCFVARPEPSASQARSLRAIAERRQILFAVPDNLNEFYAGIMNGILDAFRSTACALSVENTHERYHEQNRLLTRCLQGGVDGILFIPTAMNGRYRPLGTLITRGVPVVLVDRDLIKFQLDYVGTDHCAGAYKAVRHLIRLGHRRIAFLGLGEEHGFIGSSVYQRLNGYRSALDSAKIPPEDRIELLEKGSATQHPERQAEEMVGNALRSGMSFTAIFGVSESMVVGAYRALVSAGKRVPEDISLVSFDDSSTARNFVVPLTVVQQDTWEIGKTAARLIIERLSMPTQQVPRRQVLLPARLIVRSSTGPVRNNRRTRLNRRLSRRNDSHKDEVVS